MPMGKNMDLDEQYDKIYRYCYFRMHQREAAEDITQETFLRFLENDTYRNTGRQLQYLYTIARNLCIDAYRNEKKRELPAGFPEETEMGREMRVYEAAGEENPEERMVASLVLHQALEELAEEERELVLLRYVNQVPVGTIAGMLGISRFAVYRRLREAMRFLRNRLMGEEE